MKIGMNLNEPNYWVDDFPFLDRMKCSGAWQGTGAQYDSFDWPVSIAPRQSVKCQWPASDTETEFLIRWLGRGKFKFAPRFRVIEQGEGWMRAAIAANIDATGKSSAQLVISETDPKDPIRFISIVEKRHAALYDDGEVFDPAYFERLRGYSVLRFMDWLRTNVSTVATNDQMGAYGNRSWFLRGVPLGQCLDLARAAYARPWVNIPHLADDDLIARFAAAPGAMIEYSNEVWNTQFPQGKWAQNQATAAGITKATFIAREMALVAELLEAAGAKLLVGYQPTVREDGWKEFATTLSAAGGSSNNIAGVITSCYPTGGLNSLAAIRPYVAADDRAGVLKKLAEDIEANTALRYRSARQLADALGGVPVHVYEGNIAHLNTSRSSDEAVPFVASVQRDPAAQALAERVIAIAEAEGVANWCAFDLSSGPTRYGYFGVEGTPLGDLLDQRRAAQLIETSTPSTVEEWLAALEQRVARLESQHVVDKSPLTL